MTGARTLLLVLALSLAGAARAAPPASDGEAKARAWLTDTVLLTQDGKQVRFYEDVLANRVVAIDFIFTRCEMACPLLTEKMNRVREEIGELFGKEVFFVSISVDPEFDTPRELTKFATKHKALRGGWTWLTGSKESVKLVLQRLGKWVDDPDQHSTEFILGNTRTRHWMKSRPDAPASVTALNLRQLAAERPAVQAAAGKTAARIAGRAD